jgi:hypothetical protein
MKDNVWWLGISLPDGREDVITRNDDRLNSIQITQEEMNEATESMTDADKRKVS